MPRPVMEAGAGDAGAGDENVDAAKPAGRAIGGLGDCVCDREVERFAEHVRAQNRARFLQLFRIDVPKRDLAPEAWMRLAAAKPIP